MQHAESYGKGLTLVPCQHFTEIYLYLSPFKDEKGTISLYLIVERAAKVPMSVSVFGMRLC